VAVAALLLQFNLRRGLDLPEVRQGQASPIRRVAQSYAAAVSFVCIFIAAISLVVFLYEVFRILAPGVFELTGTRVAAARVVLAALYLALASGAIIAAHARLLPLGGWGPLPPTGGDAVYGGQPGPPPPPAPY